MTGYVLGWGGVGWKGGKGGFGGGGVGAKLVFQDICTLYSYLGQKENADFQLGCPKFMSEKSKCLKNT